MFEPNGVRVAKLARSGRLAASYGAADSLQEQPLAVICPRGRGGVPYPALLLSVKASHDLSGWHFTVMQPEHESDLLA